MKTFKLHLIRHGLTQGNIDGLYVGGGMDVPLAQEGIKQLEEMKLQYQYPQGGLVFSSPMLRALQTAAILYPEMPPPTVLEQLREYMFGEFEGKSVAEMMQDTRYAKMLSPESDLVPYGGESGKQFALRTGQALQSIMQQLATQNIAEAVCVAHGGVIVSMLGQMALPKKPFYKWMAENGAGFTVQSSAAMIMRDNLVEVLSVIPYGYKPRRNYL